MELGVTASRYGLNEIQSIIAMQLIEYCEWLRHGDCLGGDAQLHRLARLRGKKIGSYPPSNNAFRAFLDFDTQREPAPYLVRDRWLAEDSDVLAAFPNTARYVRGSGTWYTYNYAKSIKRPTILVLPSGLTDPIQWKEVLKNESKV